MTPNTTQAALRALFERFAFLLPSAETLRPTVDRDDDTAGDEEHSFAHGDEAFYWGWSRNAFL